jgi:hypothetical protein
MNRWSQENRILIALNTTALLGLATAWSIYVFLGHRFITAVHASPWIEFLHRILMMEGQMIRPLEHYFRGAEHLMWSATVIVLLACFALSVATKISSHVTINVLTPLFVIFSLTASAIAFFYPLEIETRESTAWLHVLALKHGVNIYDHAQVAFINQNHGPFDPLLKLSIATLFPFLESWQVTRFAVLSLPYAFLFFAWRLLKKSSPQPLSKIAYVGAIGYLLLILSAKEFIFVGRSDATAALLLLPLTYVSISWAKTNASTSARYGLLWGSLATLVILTNWRMLPAVFALFIFSLWTQRYKENWPFRITVHYLAGSACASLAIFAFLLFYSFDFDLSLYYKHFFGVYSQSSGHGHRTYAHAPGLWFLGSLLKPIASPDSLKGGPVLLALAVYFLVPGKTALQNRAWSALGAFVFAACTIAFYLNYYGGGQWYYLPFLILLWFFLCANYQEMNSTRLAGVGLVLLVFFGANYSTVVAPSVWRAATYSRAYAFMHELRSLDANYRVVSEDTFFYRTSYQGELIDMGDMVSRVRKKGDYYGEQFNGTVDRHFERLRTNPPDYIVSGFAESPELHQLVREKYQLFARGPENFTANGFRESRLYQRKDLAAQHSIAIRRE